MQQNYPYNSKEDDITSTDASVDMRRGHFCRQNVINTRFSTLKIEKLKGNFYESDMELKAIVQDANF